MAVCSASMSDVESSTTPVFGTVLSGCRERDQARCQLPALTRQQWLEAGAAEPARVRIYLVRTVAALVPGAAAAPITSLMYPGGTSQLPHR